MVWVLVVNDLCVFNACFINEISNFIFEFWNWIGGSLLCAGFNLDRFRFFFCFGSFQNKIRFFICITQVDHSLWRYRLSLEVIIQYLLQLLDSCFALLQQVLLMSHYLVSRPQEILSFLQLKRRLIILILKVIRSLFLLLKSEFVFLDVSSEIVNFLFRVFQI